MSLPHWVTQFSNLAQGFEAVYPFAGWIVAFGGGAMALIKRQWIFQDKAAIARERDFAVIEAQNKSKEAEFYKQRAAVAEETVEALNTAIDNLRSALTAEIETLKVDVRDLRHQTAVQTKFIRDILAFNAGRVSTPPEIPEELRELNG